MYVVEYPVLREDCSEVICLFEGSERVFPIANEGTVAIEHTAGGEAAFGWTRSPQAIPAIAQGVKAQATAWCEGRIAEMNRVIAQVRSQPMAMPVLHAPKAA